MIRRAIPLERSFPFFFSLFIRLLLLFLLTEGFPFSTTLLAQNWKQSSASPDLPQQEALLHPGETFVSRATYTLFLNSVASQGDPEQLYHPMMRADPIDGGIIQETNQDATFTYTTTINQENLPVYYVSPLSQLRFCNWYYHLAQADLSKDAPQESWTEEGIVDLDNINCQDIASELDKAQEKIAQTTFESAFPLPYFLSLNNFYANSDFQEGFLDGGSNEGEQPFDLYWVVSAGKESNLRAASSLLVSKGFPDSSLLQRTTAPQQNRPQVTSKTFLDIVAGVSGLSALLGGYYYLGREVAPVSTVEMSSAEQHEPGYEMIDGLEKTSSFLASLSENPSKNQQDQSPEVKTTTPLSQLSFFSLLKPSSSVGVKELSENLLETLHYGRNVVRLKEDLVSGGTVLLSREDAFDVPSTTSKNNDYTSHHALVPFNQEWEIILPSEAQGLPVEAFEKFSNPHCHHNFMIIAKKGDKMIIEERIDNWFGQKCQLFLRPQQTIIEEFHHALIAAFGKNIADTYFSEDLQQEALNEGLTGKIISDVLTAIRSQEELPLLSNAINDNSHKIREYQRVIAQLHEQVGTLPEEVSRETKESCQALLHSFSAIIQDTANSNEQTAQHLRLVQEQLNAFTERSKKFHYEPEGRLAQAIHITNNAIMVQKTWDYIKITLLALKLLSFI